MNRIFELCVIISSIIVALLLYFYFNAPIDLKALVNYVKGKSANSSKEYPARSQEYQF